MLLDQREPGAMVTQQPGLRDTRSHMQDMSARVVERNQCHIDSKQQVLKETEHSVPMVDRVIERTCRSVVARLCS